MGQSPNRTFHPWGVYSCLYDEHSWRARLNLLRQAQAGNQEAFAALFEQYKNLVYKTAYLMLGQAAEAEDVLQEVFVAVHRSLATYDPRKAAFTTWLHRITLNHCLNYRRGQRLHQVPLEAADSTQAPEPQAESFDNLEPLRLAVQELSDKQRAVVVLRYYWELPYAEIARILDIPLGTVKSRLDLALKTLRRALEQPDREPCSPSQSETKVYP